MRIPYTAPLPLPRIIPHDANTLPGLLNALTQFLSGRPLEQHGLGSSTKDTTPRTVLLTGAGISVAVSIPISPQIRIPALT